VFAVFAAEEELELEVDAVCLHSVVEGNLEVENPPVVGILHPAENLPVVVGSHLVVESYQVAVGSFQVVVGSYQVVVGIHLAADQIADFD